MTGIKKETGFIKSFDETPIYYEIRGEGQPIVLCYGIGCLFNHWIHQIKDFSKNYQVIVFDYRGHHNTPVPENRENLSIDAIAQDVKWLCDGLGIKKASFWGHSFGVQILIRAYDMHPELFENLVFVNGFATNPMRFPVGQEVTTSIFNLIKKGYDQLPESLDYLWKFVTNNQLTALISSLTGGFNLNLTNFKDIEVYFKGVSHIDLDVFLTLFDQMMRYDGNSVLDRIEAPALIISGSKDGITPPDYQETLHRRIKNSEFLRVPYGSHCTQLDMPDFVNLRIERFLEHTGYASTKTSTKRKTKKTASKASGKKMKKRSSKSGASSKNIESN